jgi:hypothetical protein
VSPRTCSCCNVSRSSKGSSVIDLSPFRISWGVPCFAFLHHLKRVYSWSGGAQVRSSPARIPCQTCFAKVHARIKCIIVAAVWQQSRHRGWCCSPRRANLSVVQHLSCTAIQLKNFTRGGAQFLQISFQASLEVDPWNVAL